MLDLWLERETQFVDEIDIYIYRSILIKDVVQDRLPMINQLADGLRACGMLDVVKKYPKAMKSLFCKADERLMDEDTFLALLATDFSNEQRKRLPEEDTFKAFCDFVGAACHEGLVHQLKLNFHFYSKSGIGLWEILPYSY